MKGGGVGSGSGRHEVGEGVWARSWAIKGARGVFVCEHESGKCAGMHVKVGVCGEGWESVWEWH